jgi:hypothetical protein
MIPAAKRFTAKVKDLCMQLLSHWSEQLGKPAACAKPMFRDDK